MFSTGENDQVFEAISDMLWDKNRELYALDEFDKDGLLIYQPPPLNDVWLNKEERRDKKVRLRKQRERREFSDDRVLEKIVDSTPEGVPGGAPLPVTPAPLPATPKVPPNGDNDNVPNLIKDSDSDDSSTDSSIIGFVPESEGELWADHPDIVPDIEPHVLPPPEPPPSPAVSSNEPPSQVVPEDTQTIAHQTQNSQSQPSNDTSPPTKEPGWFRDSKGWLRRQNMVTFTNLSEKEF